MALDALQTRTDFARHFARLFKQNLISPIVGYVEGDAKTPDVNTATGEPNWLLR